MVVSEWVETVWTVLSVRPKTLYDYKKIYIKHLDPIIGQSDLDAVDVVALQRTPIELPAQIAQHTLMALRVFRIEAINCGEGLLIL